MPRPIEIEGDIALITLTKGFVAVIDAADVPLISAWSWRAIATTDGSVYAGRTGWCPIEMKKVVIRLHRFLVDADDDLVVDHRDGDTLNDRRGNLREATSSQNSCNQRRNSRNTSGFKDVCREQSTGKWRARIRFESRRVSLGLFDTPEQAHDAYIAAAISVHGEFARAA